MSLTRDDFEDRNILAGHLAEQLLLGRLAIVLGAGVSEPFKLPDWITLLKRIYKKNHAILSMHESLERQAEYAKSTYYKEKDKLLIRDIHEALYRKARVDFSNLRTRSTLAAIGALIAASRRGRVSHVITFNYDNLLELYLRYHGIVVVPVFRDRHWAKSGDISVYHPHGYVPYDKSEQSSNSLVLDQQSYSYIVGKEGNLWRQTLFTIMRSHTCVFVGISGKDKNLDSILTTCKEQHIAASDNLPFWGVTFLMGNGKTASQIWQNRGVFPVRIRNYESDLPAFLFDICQKAAELCLHNSA